MKKWLVVLANILIVVVLAFFVNHYVRASYEEDAANQRTSYTNMTVAMRQMIADYLQGEQRVCNSWAYYINESKMTMQEAVNYVRGASTSDLIVGHIVYIDDGSLSGLSTKGKINKKTNAEDFAISYKSLSVINTEIELQDKTEFDVEIHMTRSYTNPSTGNQCVAFYAPVDLRDPDTSAVRKAMLMRSVPVSAMSYNWRYPTEEYANAGIALITADGDY